MSKQKTLSPQALAIVDVLKANPDRKMTFAEIAAAAGISPKATGCLKAVQTELGDHLEVDPDGVEVEVVVRKKVNGYTYHADGKDAE